MNKKIKNKLINIFKKKFKGNSLSETLIALVIVGVIFTISTGTIAADYNKNQTVVRLKKMYNVLTNAINISMTNNGASFDWNVKYGVSAEGSYNFFTNYLKPYIILAKDCKNSTEGSCNYNFKELNGVPKELNSTWARFYLSDGAFLAIQTVANDKYKLAYFYIDTNGKKRLNVVARDIFIFQLWIKNEDNPELEGQLLPYGYEYSRKYLMSAENPNNCNSTQTGNYCGALIINDNWQIIPGYPWAQARYNVN